MYTKLKVVRRLGNSQPGENNHVKDGGMTRDSDISQYLALCGEQERKDTPIHMGLTREPPCAKTFPIWQTIELGTGLQARDEFREAAKRVGRSISDRSADILGSPDFSVSPHRVEVDLVKVRVDGLGFDYEPTQLILYARAIVELGLDFCPAEVGLQLLLQCRVESINMSMSVGMRPVYLPVFLGMHPIADSGGGLNLFGISRSIEDELTLVAGYGSPRCHWPLHQEMVFVQTRK